MTHFNYETLLDYVEGRLADEQRGKVDLHLAESCRPCNHRLSLLETVVHSVAEDHTAPPPAFVLKQAADIPLTHARPSQPKPWIRLIAALTFDSRLHLSSATTRGAARERQMLFTAEQVDIDLKIKPEREDHLLIGQILGEPNSADVFSAFVSLQNKTGQFFRATETDPLGQFTFHEIPSGVYDLIFDLETQEVAVMGVEVQND
jgi:hypothetical protein